MFAGRPFEQGLDSNKREHCVIMPTLYSGTGSSVPDLFIENEPMLLPLVACVQFRTYAELFVELHNVTFVL